MKNILSEQEFIEVNNKEEFLAHYPPTKYGKYRPQPSCEPASYPCMIRQEQINDNPHGADEAVLSIIYLPEVSPQPTPTVVIKHSDKGFEVCTSSHTDVNVVLIEEDISNADETIDIDGEDHVTWTCTAFQDDEYVSMITQKISGEA